MSADPSAVPSAEPSKEPSKATEIVVKDTVALTGLDSQNKHTIAYAAYDVLDQYGESMRESVSINWTASAGTVKADKSTGLLTISKGVGAEEFVFGSLLVLVGVDTANGLSKQAQLSIGMERAVDQIDFNGFVSKNAKDKKTDIKDTLPANFAKNEWMFLYTAKDQNGNVIEATGTRKTAGELSFISNNPTLVTMDFTDYGSPLTIEGTDYDAVYVQPGMYVDKGGEFTLSVMSNKTGQSNNRVYTIGAGGVLKSVVLSAPKDAVADGDSDVKIPYKATDVSGNEVTDFETIVRSTNTLSLNAGVGTLTVKEENDGTAGFYWTDDTANYDIYTASTYQDGAGVNVHDGIDRPVALTTVVVGGESNNFMLSVSDMRIPAAIAGISANDLDADAFVVAATGKIVVADDDNGSSEEIIYKDQYGKDLDQGAAKAFFNATAPSAGAYNNYHYGIRTKMSTNTLSLSDQIYTTAAGTINITATGNSANSNSVTFSIAKVKSSVSSPAYGDWDVEGKKVTKTYETDTVANVKNLELADFGTVGVTSSHTSYANGEGLTLADPVASGQALSVEHGSDAKKVKVTGTIKGIKVKIPATYYSVAANEAGKPYVDFNANKDEIANVYDLTWDMLYDANSAKNLRKDASVKVAVTVYDTANATGSAIATPSKTLKVSDAPSTVAQVKLLKNSYGGALDGNTLNPTDMAIVSWNYNSGKWWSAGDNNYTNGYNDTAVSEVNCASFGNYEGVWSNDGKANVAPLGPIMLAVIDQYGDGVATSGGTNTPIYTISNIEENTGALAHVSNSFTVTKNGSNKVEITGAEIGDKFTVTGYVEGYEGIKATATVTVGADTNAYISNTSDSDKNFRKNILGAYDR